MGATQESDSPKRRAILSAATDLFEARGYGAVSMDAIARAAEVSKATLYAHFESKDRLFATIVRCGCEQNMAPEYGPGDIEADGGENDIEATLFAVGARMLRFFLTDRTVAIYRLVVAESTRFPELGRALYDNGPLAGRKILGGWLARQPELRVPEPEVAAQQFVDLIRSGLWMRATLGLEPKPLETEIDAAVRTAVGTFLRAYKA